MIKQLLNYVKYDIVVLLALLIISLPYVITWTINNTGVMVDYLIGLPLAVNIIWLIALSGAVVLRCGQMNCVSNIKHEQLETEREA